MNDMTIVTLLREEQSSLQKLLRQIRKELNNAPEGSVQVRRHKKGFQFYHRNTPGSKEESYIPASQRSKAIALIQKRYLERMKKTIAKQLRTVELFLKYYDPYALSRIYSSEGKLRQPFISPLILPDNQFIQEWEEVSYTRKPFGENNPAHYTMKNEQVRSKSEMMIANALYSSGIPYRYEYPLQNGAWKIHPDFTVLRIRDRKEFYWEHLGMMDDPDYRSQAFQRIRDYETMGIFPGIDLILTFETGRMPLNTKIIDRTIQAYLS